jgi:iron complex transport system ATP-binding protein
MNLIVKETHRRNIITIVVVHDINIALRYGEYVLMLKQGQLIAQGTPDKVITAQSLADVYGIQGRLEYCSQGMPQIIIDGLVDKI